MRLHVLSLPHTETTADYEHCAYTARTRDFATMMTRRGYEVTLYGGEQTDAEVSEFVPLRTTAEREAWFPWYKPTEHVFNDFDANGQGWRTWNERTVEALSSRIAPWDVLAVTMGVAQRPVADVFPDAVLKVEIGVGYEGVFAPYRVHESWAWRNYLGGKLGEGTRLYDATIPRCYDVDAFPLGDRGSHFAFVGRLIANKGVQIAAEACRALGAKLIVAGQGAAKVEPGKLTCEDGTVLECDLEYVGVVGAKERADIMGDAIATFVPTLYLEPFGGVSAESQLCGTPALVTPSGGLVENAGAPFVCSTLRDFVEAAELAASIDRAAIQARAQALWGFAPVAELFDGYLSRLSTLRGAGWYEMRGDIVDGDG